MSSNDEFAVEDDDEGRRGVSSFPPSLLFPTAPPLTHERKKKMDRWTHTLLGDTHSQHRFEKASSKSILPNFDILRTRVAREANDDGPPPPPPPPPAPPKVDDELNLSGGREDEEEDPEGWFEEEAVAEEEVIGRRDAMFLLVRREERREDILNRTSTGPDGYREEPMGGRRRRKRVREEGSRRFLFDADGLERRREAKGDREREGAEGGVKVDLNHISPSIFESSKTRS